MRKSKIFAILLSGVLLLPACSSDFLDRMPSNSVVADKSIENLNDVKVALNGMYREMTNINYYGRRMTLYADMKGGDMLIPMIGRGDDALYTFNHSSTTGSYSGMYTQIYVVLAQVNNILSNIEAGNVELSSAADKVALEDAKGQALAIRALCHFDLARLYGYPYQKDQGASLGFAIVTKPLTYSDKLSRNTVAQMYIQIIEDLDNAMKGTDGNGGLSKDKNNGYVNYYAAESILARVYLYKGDYDKAFALADDVIRNGGYTLYSNSGWVASWGTQYGSESIFELAVDANENDLGASSLSNFLSATGSTKAAYASNSFLSRLEEDGDDIRWGIMNLDEYGLASGSYAGRKGWIKKYPGDGKATETATNIKLIRLSELYLIAAEAAARMTTPDLTAAAGYVNEIRKRSPNLTLADATDGADAIVDIVFTERSKELIAEGHRFFDLMRVNKGVAFDDAAPSEVIAVSTRPKTIDWTFNKIVLPIDKDELTVNPAIRDQQNPGY